VPKLIAILEDNTDRVRVMTDWLADRLPMYDRVITDDPDTLIAALQARWEDTLVVSLDHDLHERPDGDTDATGMEVVRFLLDRPVRFPVLIHSSNRVDSDLMQRKLNRRGWQVVRVHPFEDTVWIGTDWYPAIKKAMSVPATGGHSLQPSVDGV
jgi:hypothetical protein